MQRWSSGSLGNSNSHRALFATQHGSNLAGRLLDALLGLLVRLPWAGSWGECSLWNTLFRMDPGAFGAYLADTENSEMHRVFTNGLLRRLNSLVYRLELG